MAEDMCRTSEVTEITPPGIGAVVLKELPAAGKEGIVYVIEGDPIATYIWDGEQFVSIGGGGGGCDFIIVPPFWYDAETEEVIPNAVLRRPHIVGEQEQGCELAFDYTVMSGGGGVASAVYINGEWFNQDSWYTAEQSRQADILVDGFTRNGSGSFMVVDCDDPAYAIGQTINLTVSVEIDGGAPQTQTITYTIVDPNG